MDIRTIMEKLEKTILMEGKKDDFYVEKEGDEYHIFDSKGKSKANFTSKKEADKKCKEMNNTIKEEIKEADEPTAEPAEDDTQIKPKMGFERFLKLLFKEEDQKIGRIALRKILNNKEDTLTLRERTTVSYAAMRLIPILADDRVTFQRIERKLAE
jgi:hypothetical protein